jgi:hypothetical protein
LILIFIFIFIFILLLGELMLFPCIIPGVVGARFLVTAGADGDDSDGTDLGGVNGVGREVDRCLSACKTGDGTGCNGMKPNASQGCCPLALGDTTPAGGLRYRLGSRSMLPLLAWLLFILFDKSSSMRLGVYRLNGGVDGACDNDGEGYPFTKKEGSVSNGGIGVGGKYGEEENISSNCGGV